MERSLADLIATQARATGLDPTALTCSDLDYLSGRVREVFAGLQARKTWHAHIGSVLSHRQILEITGWTKQGLSHAVRHHRVLKLAARDGSSAYAAATFSDRIEPLRPLSGIKPVLAVWSTADPSGWITAAWLTTAQPGLDGRTPRQALLDGAADEVASLAHQTTARLRS